MSAKVFGFIKREDPYDPEDIFAVASVKCQELICEAVSQYENEDYTPLDEPVRYNILWLAFTHVTYDVLDFRMNDLDREYLKAVTRNFKNSVEDIANYSLDITIDLHFIEDTTPLSKLESSGNLYLARETIKHLIEKCSSDKDIDTVLTTIQTKGNDNRDRNILKGAYRDNKAALGLAFTNITGDMPYSTFDLTLPEDGTYPLEDTSVPSLYATAVAVHEWMHQFECLGKMLSIEYPPTHAYQGSSLYPGYREYISNENDYDYFEFYKLVLTGKLPYEADGNIKHVGMYPKMWPLIKRNVFNIGCFTIRGSGGEGYLTGKTSEPKLSLSDEPCVWKISCSVNGGLILSPKDIPDMRIDLNNAWDSEGNTIGLQYPTNYPQAQTWSIKKEKDGLYLIETVFESKRVLTATADNVILCSDHKKSYQRWIIEPCKDS